MWGSLEVGNHSSIIDMGDELRTVVASTLLEHPLIKSKPNVAISIAKEAISIQKNVELLRPKFPRTGEGWFEMRIGKTADELISYLQKSEGNDDLIKSIELLHLHEAKATLESLDWADNHHDTMIQLGLDERTLKSLRIYGDLKKNTLMRACLQWENANSVLKSLDQYHDIWSQEETNAWEGAMQSKQDAKDIWKSALNQFNTLSKQQQNWLNLAKEELKQDGALTARQITERLIDKGIKRLNVNRMAKLLKMYGEEISIIKSHRKGEYLAAENNNLIIKDIWPYAAGFIDEYGEFSLTDRGELRLTMLTKGDRGRLHCQQLHNNLGFGALHINKSVSATKPNTHQLQFRDMDVGKLLSGALPYIVEKQTIAKAVARYFLEPDNMLRKQFIQYQSYGTTKAEKALRQWGVDEDTVLSWAED